MPIRFYELGRLQDPLLFALMSPDRTESAAAVLARIGTPDAQSALWKTARRRSLPSTTRQAAADAWVASVQRYHVMMTPQQLDDRRQYADDPIHQQLTQALQSALDQQ